MKPTPTLMLALLAVLAAVAVAGLVAPADAAALHGKRAVIVRAAATYVGVTPRTLVAELRTGKSLAQVATANAKTVAATGSNIAVIAARDAGICRKDAARSANGTIVPSTTIHAIKSQTGSERCSMRPSNEVVSSTSSRGNDDHGWKIAQKIEASRKP